MPAAKTKFQIPHFKSRLQAAITNYTGNFAVAGDAYQWIS
jgi:hypothetical protein